MSLSLTFICAYFSAHNMSLFQSYFFSKSIIIIFLFSDKGRGIRADGFVFSSLCYQPIKFESEIACSPFRSDATATWKCHNVIIWTCCNFHLKMLHFYKAAKSIIICNLYNDVTSTLNLLIRVRQYADPQRNSIVNQCERMRIYILPYANRQFTTAYSFRFIYIDDWILRHIYFATFQSFWERYNSSD